MTNDPENPFEPPNEDQTLSEYRPSPDPSIENEPQFISEQFLPFKERSEPVSDWSDEDEIVEHTVWDEPALSTSLTGHAPDNAITFKRWLQKKIATTSRRSQQNVTWLTAIASGFFAIVGTFLMGTQSTTGVVHIMLSGPVTEEILKIAVTAWIIEKRPYLFSSGRAILFTTACSGFTFSALENLIYLRIYVPNPDPFLVIWRWTVCVLLHTGCSACAGFGLVRVWKATMETFEKPELRRAYRHLLAAITMHAIYNSITVIASLTPFHF